MEIDGRFVIFEDDEEQYLLKGYSSICRSAWEAGEKDAVYKLRELQKEFLNKIMWYNPDKNQNNGK